MRAATWLRGGYNSQGVGFFWLLWCFSGCCGDFLSAVVVFVALLFLSLVCCRVFRFPVVVFDLLRCFSVCCGDFRSAVVVFVALWSVSLVCCRVFHFLVVVFVLLSVFSGCCCVYLSLIHICSCLLSTMGTFRTHPRHCSLH